MRFDVEGSEDGVGRIFGSGSIPNSVLQLIRTRLSDLIRTFLDSWFEIIEDGVMMVGILKINCFRCRGPYLREGGPTWFSVGLKTPEARK